MWQAALIPRTGREKDFPDWWVGFASITLRELQKDPQPAAEEMGGADEEGSDQNSQMCWLLLLHTRAPSFSSPPQMLEKRDSTFPLLLQRSSAWL